MHILTNGCSNTFGANLVPNDLLNSKDTFADADAERIQLTYGYHLKNLLGADSYTNLAMSCGSNGRIIRTTLDWCLSQDADTLKNTVAVIQWTHGMRYEYYISNNSHNVKEIDVSAENKIQDPTRWARVMAGVRGGVEGEPTEINGYSVNELAQLRYLLWTPQECMYRDIECYSALKSIFESFSVRYFYWHLLGYCLDGELHNWAVRTFNWINTINPAALEVEGNLLPKGYDLLPCNHPSIKGHRDIAEQIYRSIKDRI